MRVLFDGSVPVAYGQMYVTSRELPGMEEAFAGQANGLCGAGDAGALFLMTGTHSGEVHLTVELHDAAPGEAAPEWEDVVEVPFRPRAAAVELVPWGDGPLARLPLGAGEAEEVPAAYRVRYCAAGMDLGRDPFGGRDPDTIADDDYSYMEDRPDRYLLCFWPDPGRAADAVLRRTSASAGSWHDWAGALPPPPTPAEQAATEPAARRE